MLEGLDQLLKDRSQPGLTELREVLRGLLGGDAADGCWLDERQLSSPHPRVFRLRFGLADGVRSFVIKRLEPAIAQRDQLVARRWLPAMSLGDCGPGLLGVAAERSGECVWHVYEDFGDCALDASAPEGRRVQAAVELIARIHTRFANHWLLSECRLHGGELGINFFAANVRDAIRCLEALRPPENELSPDRAALCERLRARLHKLSDEQPARADALAELGGPETLLHGDLWTTNTLVIPTALGLRARLIDWDHAAVGPVSYDLSTFLLRFGVEERPWILDLYREAVSWAGWRLPAAHELNLLFETAEYARFANRVIWPAIAIARDDGEWGFDALAEVEQWFTEMQPVLREDRENETAKGVVS